MDESTSLTLLQSINLNMKKEYCSYWIRHGECDYQQQGECPRHSWEKTC